MVSGRTAPQDGRELPGGPFVGFFEDHAWPSNMEGGQLLGGWTPLACLGLVCVGKLAEEHDVGMPAKRRCPSTRWKKPGVSEINSHVVVSLQNFREEPVFSGPLI